MKSCFSQKLTVIISHALVFTGAIANFFLSSQGKDNPWLLKNLSVNVIAKIEH